MQNETETNQTGLIMIRESSAALQERVDHMNYQPLYSSFVNKTPQKPRHSCFKCIK